MKLYLLHMIIFISLVAPTIRGADVTSAAAGSAAASASDGPPLVVTTEEHNPVSPTQAPVQAPQQLKIQEEKEDASGNRSLSTLTPRSQARVLSLVTHASNSTTVATDTLDLNNPIAKKEDDQKKCKSAADLCASGNTTSSTNSAGTGNGTVEDGRAYLKRVAAKREKADAAGTDGDSPTVGTPTASTPSGSLTQISKYAAQRARLKIAHEASAVLKKEAFAAAAVEHARATHAATITATLTEALTKVDLKKAKVHLGCKDSLKAPLASQVPAPVSIPPSRSGTLKVEICGYTSEDFEDCDPEAVHTPQFIQKLEEYNKLKAAQAAAQGNNASANPTRSPAVVAVTQLVRTATLETFFPQTVAGSESSAAASPADTLGTQPAQTNSSVSVAPTPAPLVIPQPHMPSAASAAAVAIRRPITPPADTWQGWFARIAKDALPR